VGFVNGLPLVIIELKKPGVPARAAFDENLTHYKAEIPASHHAHPRSLSHPMGEGLVQRAAHRLGRHGQPVPHTVYHRWFSTV